MGKKLLPDNTKSPTLIILLTVGILSLSLGLERVHRFKRLDQQLNMFTNLLTSLSGCQQLIGQNDVYGTATRLCSTVQNQIRALVIGRSSKAPTGFAETISKKLRETKQAGIPIKYEIVLIIDFEKIPSDFHEGINRRLATYKKFGVSDLASIYILDVKPSIGFDMFIVDRRHVIIGMTMLAGVNSLQGGLLFENQHSIASALTDWYDQNLIRSAIPFEKWILDYPMNTSRDYSE